MLVLVSDLPEFNLLVPEAAFDEALHADRCAVCLAPALGRDASPATVLRWLDTYDTVAAAQMRKAIVEGDAEAPDRPHPWYHILSRAATDSKLAFGYAVPYTVLELLMLDLDSALEDFFVEQFLISLCDRCAAAQLPVEEVAPRLRRIYIQERFDGNERAARAQPSWPMVERIVSLIDAAAIRHQRLA